MYLVEWIVIKQNDCVRGWFFDEFTLVKRKTDLFLIIYLFIFT